MGSNPSHFSVCGPDCPVEEITFYDVERLIAQINRRSGWPGFRLPTEAEWEYSCRAGGSEAVWRVIVADDRRRQLRRTYPYGGGAPRKISTDANTRWHVRSQSLGAVRHVWQRLGVDRGRALSISRCGRQGSARGMSIGCESDSRRQLVLWRRQRALRAPLYASAAGSRIQPWRPPRARRKVVHSPIMGNRQTVEPLTAAEFADAFPHSRKVYVEGSRGVRVPMREITLSGGEPALRVYDASGPQGIDPRQGPAGAAPRLGARPRRRRIGRHPSGGRARARSDAPARPWSRHAAALRAQARDHAGDGVHRDSRRLRAGVRAIRGRARPGHHPGEHQPPRARADDHRPAFRGEDQRQHRQLRRQLVDRRGSREAALGDAVGRRHGDGLVDRARHSRDARVDHPQLRGPDRDRADLPGAREGRRTAGRPDVGHLSRHADRAGGAGRRLLHRARRRAAALHSADGAPRDRHRLARRLDHRQVVPGAPPGELPLHALPRDLRDHAGLRRLVLARRRAAARLDRRRQRRGAVRRAEDPGRADAHRVGVRRAGHERRPGSRADAPDPREHGEAARVVRRGAVLHARAR